MILIMLIAAVAIAVFGSFLADAHLRRYLTRKAGQK